MIGTLENFITQIIWDLSSLKVKFGENSWKFCHGFHQYLENQLYKLISLEVITENWNTTMYRKNEFGFITF